MGVLLVGPVDLNRLHPEVHVKLGIGKSLTGGQGLDSVLKGVKEAIYCPMQAIDLGLQGLSGSSEQMSCLALKYLYKTTTCMMVRTQSWVCVQELVFCNSCALLKINV